MSKKLQQEKINRLYHKLSLKYNLNKEEIKRIVESQFEFTNEKLKQIDISKIQSEEDEEKYKTNFLYKYWGKLYTNFKLINRRRKQSEAYKKINKKKWEKKK